ncbi:hypothetical protein E4U54_001660 [Claviceps lovelessii]|nr:hypothetical protein E4U54_001660 [Claviceps lovelessii]
MNKPGYVFAPPHGCNPHQTSINTAQSSRHSVMYQPNGNSRASFGEQNAVALSYGHSMIPGLGLGAANRLAHTPWTVPNEYAAGFQAQSHNAASITQIQPTVQTRHASVKIPGLNGGRDDVSEDGEVNENGGIEDVYEPASSHQQPTAVGRIQEQIWTAASRAPDDTSQQLSNDRDASYSPRLSPQELLQSNNRALQEPATSSHEKDQSGHSRLEDAKNQAKDAILHLWPLDVRFHNFLAEGIDKALLKSLFQDLGLNTDEPPQTYGPANATTAAVVADKCEAPVQNAEAKPLEESIPAAKDKSEARKDRIARLLAAKGSKPSVQTISASQPWNSVSLGSNQNEAQAQKEMQTQKEAQAQTQTESQMQIEMEIQKETQTQKEAQAQTQTEPQMQIEMEIQTQPQPKAQTQTQIETRIEMQTEAQTKAQIKAQTEAHTETQIKAQTKTQTKTQKQANKGAKSSMSQVEKSKLIQEKLAALKRAREMPQRLKAVQTESSDSGQNDTSLEALRTANAAGRSESIPGLSLSPIKRTSESSEATAEPSSTLQGAVSQKTGFSTPFDQIPPSRPFLIDVSEEEEDEGEEMEIDSPVRAQTSPSMLGTPVQHDALLDDSFAPSESSLSRRAQSPATVSMPLRSASINKSGDLESMNKKIEEMKQKIAEAEARKKAKNSRQGSPALSQRHDSSLEDSCEIAPRQTVPVKPFYGDVGLTCTPSLSPSQRRRSRSRVASERLPLLEARRREQLEKLRDLQSEVARIERELEKDKLEQERLEEELMCSHSDKDEEDLVSPAEQALTAEVAQMPQLYDKMDVAKESSLPKTTDEGQEKMLVEQEQQNQSPDELSALDVPVSNYVAAVANNEGSRAVANLSVSGLTATSFGEDENAASHGSTSSDMDTSQSDDAPPPDAQVNDEDVAMEDTGYSADEDVEEDFEDDYEPPDVTQRSLAADDEPVLPDRPSLLSKDDGGLLAVEKAMAATGSSAAANDRKSSPHLSQASVAAESTLPSTSSTSFVPYETPLQYFHAYRFHPSFNQSVAGGLRSLTYSNKIDVKKELCPDELAGQACPRGRDCDYQHFDTIQAPDDQILLQLGAAEHYDDPQRDKYISGLKQLLTDFRNRKVRDFQIISQGIVDYRAQFLGDKTKILPLGHITL